MISQELLKMLACPNCESRPQLKLNQEKDKLNCSQCSKSYPIQDGIPVLLVSKEI